ncbi:short-chain dehydrogenase, partial [Metarhizium majus ARSEF 297]
MASPKVFIVTGASKGIGAAVTRYLLEQSHKVVVTARSAKPLEGIKKAYPGQVEYVAGDMTSAEMPDKLTSLAVASFGKLHGLVINHGLLVSSRLENTSIDTFKNLYNVNVFSCLAMAQAALGELRKTKGCVVWVSSGAALKPYTGWSAYGSSKAALNSLSSHLAFEEKDITSITVSPGRVDTDMQVQIRSSGQQSMDKAQYDTFIEAFEQGKLLKPEQPGNVIAKFVATPKKELSGKDLK